MRIIIGDNTRNAMQILGIDAYPFTEQKLKSKFRRMIHRYHEDKEGGDKEKAQEVIRSYKHLQNLVMVNGDFKQDAEQIQEPELWNPVIPKGAIII